MTTTLKEKVNGISKVLKVYNKLIKRLPTTYPRTSLVIHLSEKELEEYFLAFYRPSKKEQETPPYAFCDLDLNTIHIHATMSELTIKEIARYLLHEIGHLYADLRYGRDDPRTNDKDANKIDEAYADRFSNRWIRHLRDEGWFS